MADELRTFLIAMAKDEDALARFVKNPRAEAVKAGLSREDIAVLTQPNAHRIFQRLRKEPGEGIVWVCRVRVPHRPKKYVQRKATARKRR